MKNSFGNFVKNEWNEPRRCRGQREHWCRHRMIEALQRMTYIQRVGGCRILVDDDSEQRLQAAKHERDRENRAIYGGASAIAERGLQRSKPNP